jgi:activating signal cointegrator complex subunit 2
MHLISLISQVQEVFPDLGEGFIEACLSTYDNNIETVIDRILTESLPEHLALLDHALSRYVIFLMNFKL